MIHGPSNVKSNYGVLAVKYLLTCDFYFSKVTSSNWSSWGALHSRA